MDYGHHDTARKRAVLDVNSVIRFTFVNHADLWWSNGQHRRLQSEGPGPLRGHLCKCITIINFVAKYYDHLNTQMVESCLVA